MAAVAIAVLWNAGCQGPLPAGPLRHEAYVWQREWTPAVAAAVERAIPTLAGVTVLGAEVDFRDPIPHVVSVGPAWEALAALPTAVGVAIRIAPYGGEFADGDEHGRALGTIAVAVVAEARGGGVEPVEVQLDFDAGVSQLAGYRHWVTAVRSMVAPVPVVVTALPAWLGAAAFDPLARAAGSFVLQVHSLDRPRRSRPFVLCDPHAAGRAVARAARAAVPFRVALPTYGYLAAIDAEGRLTGLVAEGLPPPVSRGGRLIEVRADAAAMARLVRGWERRRPPELTGIIWYRLPVQGDSRNWRWLTLSEIVRGHVPESALKVDARTPRAGLIEIDLVNRGTADAAVERVRLRWSGAALLAADGLGSFGATRLSETALVLETPRDVWLAPGGRRTIGWLRFDRPVEVRADVVPSV